MCKGPWEVDAEIAPVAIQKGMEIPPGSASRSPTWRSRAARTVGSPSATSTPTSSEERPSARRVWESSGRPRTHRRADEEGTPASAPLRGALPTVGLPVMPRLGVKTTWRVDSHFSPPAIHTGPTAYPQRRQRLTLPRAGRSAPHGRHRPGRERPPKPRAWYGRGTRCVFTRLPPSPRVAPDQGSRAGRLFSAATDAADQWGGPAPGLDPHGPNMLVREPAPALDFVHALMGCPELVTLHRVIRRLATRSDRHGLASLPLAVRLLVSSTPE